MALRAARRTGAAIVALRARPGAVARTLAHMAPAYLMLLAPPALAAAVEGAWPLAAALGAPAAAAALLAVVMMRRAPPRDLRAIEGLTTIALAFCLGALLAAPAFHILGMRPAAALFEAVSGITTTGLSAAASTEGWPRAAHFLRAWLQWCGGFAFLASALALVTGPGAVARRIGEIGVAASDDLLASTQSRARGMLALYAGLTAIVAALSAALAGDPLDGVFLALAAVSTGGFAPESASIGDESRWLQAVVMTGCVLGAISFALFMRARRDGPVSVLRDPALRLIVILLIGSTGLILMKEAAAGPLTRDAVFDVMVATSSALSTAGFSASDMSALPPAALALLIALMAVGGDVGSTAGGLKATRVVVALAAVRLTFARSTAPPGAVTPLRALGKTFDADEIAGLAALATVYALSVGALWVALMAIDADPLFALFDAVSALSTVGLSTGVIGAASPDWALALFTAAMMLGRLEFFAVLAVLRPASWRLSRG